MIRFLLRTLKWLTFALLGLLILLAAPVAYNELACVKPTRPSDYAAILPAEHHREEARTLLTYPEWHIVHAYDDYARVIADGDPHAFGYGQAIAGFWKSLCPLSEAASAHGGFSGEVKQTIYTIGVSFSAEMLAKAAYEETLGRLATVLRGEARAPLDDLSARQAAEYAAFLQQVPWYRYDFRADAAALDAAATEALRDKERGFALGAEYAAKAAYADVIAAALANMKPDELRLRMILTGVEATTLAQNDEITVIAQRPEGLEIETPRYRALTAILAGLAEKGATFVEIAGNDDILFTATSPAPHHPKALHSFARQGYGDTRHLILVKVSDLAETLRGLEREGLVLEHIHDY